MEKKEAKVNKIVQKMKENHEIIAIFVVSAIIFFFIFDFYDWILWLVLYVILYFTITFRINIAQWQADYRLHRRDRRKSLGKNN